MHLCKQRDCGNESRELKTRRKTHGRYEYYIMKRNSPSEHTVSKPTGQAVSQEKQAVRAQFVLDTALGVGSGFALRSGPD